MSDFERGYDHVTAEELLEHFGCEYRETNGRTGLQWNVRDCPKCGKEDWKVYLNQETGLGNCFRCGNINRWSFAAWNLGTDDAKAVGGLFDSIAKMGGWKPKPVKRERVIVPVIDGALKLPRSFDLPTPQGQTLPYLNDRGISLELQRYFHLRFCQDGAFDYRKEDGTQCRMPFSGRIIIPVFDLDAQLVTFQGRDITGQAEKKYLFPPRLPGTARFLYNGHNALDRQHIVMGEGAFDVMAIKSAFMVKTGFREIEAVGSFGKKLSLDGEGPNQLTALLALKARGLTTITIMWDGETSAINSAFEAAEQLTRYGFKVRIAFLPKGKDPNEISPELVRKAFELAMPYSAALKAKVKLRKPYGVK